MIAFGGRDKFIGLYPYLESVGVMLYQRDNLWVSNVDESATQAAIDGYTLAMARGDVSSRVSGIAKEKRDRVVAAFSAGEMASWSIKDSEAAAYVDEATAQTLCPLLYAEAQARHTTTAAIRARVLANAAAFRSVEAGISGHAGYLRDQASAAADFSALAALDITSGWPV